MKKILVVLLSLTLSMFFITYEANAKTIELKENEAYLYYMYSTKEGHFFLDPDSEYENVIFIGYDDFKFTKLHHGKKYIGIFYDSTKWELEGMKEIKKN